MSPSINGDGEEQLLTRYLLGTLPEDEAERLDERSIADDDFALRLDAVENDLVDAFLRGELPADLQEQFRSSYLSSPRRVEKLEFAKALRRLKEKKAAAAGEHSAAAAAPPALGERTGAQGHGPGRGFTFPSLGGPWLLPAAALLVFLASGYLFVENVRLGREWGVARQEQAALDRRAQELERQLSEERATMSGLLKELESLRGALPIPKTLKTISVLLFPQTRGLGQTPAVSVPQGTERVLLRLQLETDEYPSYQIELTDPANGQILWHSTKLRAVSEGAAKAVSISLPAEVLKRQNYVLELSGLSEQGGPEFLSSYPFKVMAK